MRWVFPISRGLGRWRRETGGEGGRRLEQRGGPPEGSEHWEWGDGQLRPGGSRRAPRLDGPEATGVGIEAAVPVKVLVALSLPSLFPQPSNPFPLPPLAGPLLHPPSTLLPMRSLEMRFGQSPFQHLAWGQALDKLQLLI